MTRRPLRSRPSPRGSSRALLLLIALSSLVGVARAERAAPAADLVAQLDTHQYDLSSSGKAFLLGEARRVSFFLLGELHGEREIPALLGELWPEMWRDGYHAIAAEVSPWAARRLEFGAAGRPAVKGLWTVREATFVHSFSADPRRAVLWGCDMDEPQLDLLIRDLAAANPRDTRLARAVEMLRAGYKRAMAADLLALVGAARPAHDVLVDGTSLYANIVAGLEIERLRSSPATRLRASLRREALMKDLFRSHYERSLRPGEKVFARFGRNHLHRGYDARGVSTLGNFIAEFAVARGAEVFNVAAFGGGGRIRLGGESSDWDERQDEPAFGLMAERARYPATVFDLRPLRELLHAIPAEKRSALETNLIYWSDSYDAIIYYRMVTPLEVGDDRVPSEDRATRKETRRP